MDNESNLETAIWLQGSLWVLYAWAYARYFSYLALLRSAEPRFDKLPGSPARLTRMRIWSHRVAVILGFATCLELVKSSWFTASIITVLPCVFGIWILKAVWVEVFCCKVPKKERPQLPKVKELRKSKMD